MGIFRTTVEVARLAVPDQRRQVTGVMVDAGSEYNWIPRPLLEELSIRPQRTNRFQTADGRLLDREVGFALLYAAGRSAPSIVVFAERGDLVLLGAHELRGLNVRVDRLQKALVPAGPSPRLQHEFRGLHRPSRSLRLCLPRRWHRKS
ncbi:MAG TPA: hypothetical protein VFU01_13980 [Gemmatimonadaceae bacterium]|nr:hypothetical protein [Gemmatimonadaceae bacterium]